MPSWCRQVNWGNCGIPWVNCAVFCVKDDWKGHFWGLRYCFSNWAIYSVFPSGMTSHSKVTHFNWESIRSFRRRFTAARLLRLWVRIPPGAWMSVCYECCVLSGRGLCVGLITRSQESYWLCCVVVCDLETSWIRPWSTEGCSAKKQRQKRNI